MSFEEKVGQLPKAAGVYFLKDSSGRVLYIGKAKSLRSRVGAYLREDQESPKIAAMVPQIHDVDYLETGSEVEALLAEQRLVKDVKPKYNTELKDDKSFPSLEITHHDDFPLIRLTRVLDSPDSVFFGPFTEVGPLRGALKVLQKIFRFRTCNLRIERNGRAQRYTRPCLLYHIERCSAPCSGNISQVDYRKSIDELIDFLSGRKDEVIAELRARMNEASSEMAFEEAARYRDQIEALEGLDSAPELVDPGDFDIKPISPEEGVSELQDRLKLKDPPRMIEGIDISNISGTNAAGSKVTFLDGIPYKSGYRRYKIRTGERDDYSMIAEVVRRRFSRASENGLPDLLLIDGGLGHVNEAASVLTELGVNVPCLGLAKKHEAIYRPGQKRPLRLKPGDPALRLLQCVRDEAHRFARRYHQHRREKQCVL